MEQSWLCTGHGACAGRKVGAGWWGHSLFGDPSAILQAGQLLGGP